MKDSLQVPTKLETQLENRYIGKLLESEECGVNPHSSSVNVLETLIGEEEFCRSVLNDYARFEREFRKSYPLPIGIDKVEKEGEAGESGPPSFPPLANRGAPNRNSDSSSPIPCDPSLRTGGYDGGTEIGFDGEWDREKFDSAIHILSIAQKEAQKTKKQEPIASSLNGLDILVYPTGTKNGGFYNYIFEGGKEWYSSDKPITRVEYRVDRDVLQELEINSVEDLRKKEASLVEYLTSKWFRVLKSPKKKHGNEHDAKVHPIWAEIQKAFADNFTGICNNNLPIERGKKKPVSCDPMPLVKQAAGCLATAAARCKKLSVEEIRYFINELILSSNMVTEITDKAFERQINFETANHVSVYDRDILRQERELSEFKRSLRVNQDFLRGVFPERQQEMWFNE